ncbi:KRAB-A domain-containing protein 2 [Trichonephila clavipes]|uniref:KRAB-A domain-containing protein 2 n=1 Tax=Trichonephila clavipes TaxID=2585209 RepID=A0A8X6REL6_TRICX|nr:KRAB-A domain-containing protein 2 [Trichonephila clavipes]
MVHQDHLTKFEIFKSWRLESWKSSLQLVDIFLLLEAPFLLHSDNAKKLANNMVTRLKEFWPSLKIHGKPRHLQSQGSVERANKNMPCTWMQGNCWSPVLGGEERDKLTTCSFAPSSPSSETVLLCGDREASVELNAKRWGVHLGLRVR